MVYVPWETAKNIFFGNAIAVLLFMEIEARRTAVGKGKERASIGQEAVTTWECAEELTLRSQWGGSSRRMDPCTSLQYFPNQTLSSDYSDRMANLKLWTSLHFIAIHNCFTKCVKVTTENQKNQKEHQQNLGELSRAVQCHSTIERSITFTVTCMFYAALHRNTQPLHSAP